MNTKRRTMPSAPDASREADRLRARLTADPYRSYLYAYPHKTAYRPFDEPIRLEQLWEGEPAETFFLYMHIPFCGARCGFCNLFTLPDKSADAHEQYVDALERQAKQWAPFAKRRPFSRFAIGGGTPTLLAPRQLERLFEIATERLDVDLDLVSISVETSPETVNRERLAILRENRVDRVSMGIQSFVEAEAAAIYRPQKPDEVERALTLLRAYDFPILNLDLIYGLPGQTVDSWLYSLERALAHDPEEIFLYPLYTREHTIVKPSQVKESGTDIRMACYLAARERLLAAGYRQYSMRRFAKAAIASDKTLLPYDCQEEGMVGLGCGARSYTRDVHYASRYAVGRKATASIIADYVQAERYDTADYGIVLNREELRRRYILKAILHAEGLELSSYSTRFGSAAIDDYVELGLLAEAGLAVFEAGRLKLTVAGLALSDAIGDWFITPDIRARMEGFEMR
ncbi:STM4012 family radical SAM protein [Paenibacillus methanolicus]|uniref:Heme chaperone HemW n=1 Tax=Paenibacillus methanolicus TaxID=582686 RepID=A0A5S5CJY3_9BACL|nr:STM4012 family radical SAM protein [Paenibacillus methanolicus]TYP79217.1 oxygen-independent coproporphyrinogen-3 oxidase [Paenibacillus methanolicus]